MTKQDANNAVEDLIESGFDEEDVYVYDNYSGRGMYGKKTYGVVLDSIYMMDMARESSPILENSKWDTLGLGIVFY